jgi:hypothetical protein
VKSINVKEGIQEWRFDKVMWNLRRALIFAPIGFLLERRGFSLRLHVAEVVSAGSEWWASTAKAKAVMGIKLGVDLRMASDAQGAMKIADCCPIRLETVDACGFFWLGREAVGERFCVFRVLVERS